MNLRLKVADASLSTSGGAEARAPTREDGDFVQSFARGLAVIEAFDRDHPAMTLSEVARHAGLTRAAARRLLLTLCELGYAESDGRRFALRPKVLKLGFAFLHAQGIWDLAQPFLVELVERIHESCSIAVLDGADIVYVARVPTRTRIMSINLGIGSRLPAHATSLGRVLLAGLSDAELEQRLASGAPFAALTEHTVTDPNELRRRILAVRAQGWCLLDQELELGLRSLAVPLRGAAGGVVAALNTGLQASRFTPAAMRDQILPVLQSTAQRISQALGGT
jgi:IclR family pca regulon transcriptional regulator